MFYTQQNLFLKQLEAQWAKPVLLTFHSALRKLNTRVTGKDFKSTEYASIISESQICYSI
jgi:hypothetical protein